MFERIKTIISAHPVVVFLAGTPQEPFCGFSRKFVEEMKNLAVDYRSFDIVADNDMRCWLRLYSGWRTYPQLYINNKLIGGYDSTKELIKSGEFQKIIADYITK
jgi:Grx4 family monothiol glutaredoxin